MRRKGVATLEEEANECQGSGFHDSRPAIAVWAGSGSTRAPGGTMPPLTLIGCGYLVLCLLYFFRPPAMGLAIGTRLLCGLSGLDLVAADVVKASPAC